MSDVRTDGLTNARPGREATTGAHLFVDADVKRGGAARKRRAREEVMVPPAEFTSYYGKPVLNAPTWEARNIAGYLFLGGLAAGSSLVGAGAQVTGRPGLARAAKLGSTAAAGLSLVALVDDLGRPSRFVNMLRVFKPTSPMSVGSWLLAGYVPASAVASALDINGRMPVVGALATTTAAAFAPAVASYTAVLVSNTAVPAWNEARREMPFVFVASAAASAAGWGLVCAPHREAGPLHVLGAAAGMSELVLSKVMEKRLGLVGESYHSGRADRYRKITSVLLGAGTIGALFTRRHGIGARVAGAALLAGSAVSRFAIFEAGVNSARDPKYTVVPQRERVNARDALNES